MKKIFLFITILFLSIEVRPMAVSKSIVVDGIAYVINYNTSGVSEDPGVAKASVVSNTENPYTGSIIIPLTIDAQLKNGAGEYYTAEFTVTCISGGAFRNCTGLTSISIPSSVTCIGYNLDRFGTPEDYDYANPFYGCSNLVNISVSEDNPKYDSRDNCNAIIEKESNCLLVACKNTIIPNSVVSIGDYTYSGFLDLSSFSISDNIKSIGKHAFEGCTNLTSFLMHNNIQSIGEYAFSGCENLTSITLPTSVTIIEAYTFSGCESLKNITVPENVGVIYSAAFKGCSSLEDFMCYANEPPALMDYYDKISGNSISDPVFDDNIKNATLHVHDYSIELFKTTEPWSSFKNISVFEKVTDFKLVYYVDGEEYKTVKYKYDDEITIEPSLEKDGYTFSGWSEIPTKMPGKDVRVDGTFTRNEVTANGVTYWALNEKAFVLGYDNASGEVRIVEKVTFNEKELPVTGIMDNAFNGCKGITTIDMPATITIIGERAFAGIDKLTDVTISAEEVPVTDRTAFENSYIEDYVTLHVPGGSIGKYKEVAPWKNFNEVVAIAGTEVNQKYTLTYTVDGEVYKSYQLKEGDAITPEAEPTKEGYTFSGWSEIPETMPAHDVEVAGSFTKNEEEQPETYEVGGMTYEIGEDGVTIVDGGDAAGHVIIEATVTINVKTYKVTVIGEGAFKGNERITSVTIPDGIGTILANAFNGCSGLRNLILGKGIKKIGCKAFAGIGKGAGARTRDGDGGLVVECYTDAVPEADSDCFEGVDVASAILRVNDELTGIYKTTSPWNQFGTILGFDEETSISTLEIEQQGAMIFSIDGRRLDAPQRGVNIVRTQRGVKKVVGR